MLRRPSRPGQGAAPMPSISWLVSSVSVSWSEPQVEREPEGPARRVGPQLLRETAGEAALSDPARFRVDSLVGRDREQVTAGEGQAHEPRPAPDAADH